MELLQKYIKYLRGQSKHMQHVHAFVFAGGITILLAGIIMYADHGFWRERYVSEEVQEAITEEEAVEPAPPGVVLSSFWEEARAKFSNLGESGASLLEGKETYSR